MEIAVMGATGNVGGELVRLLADDGHGVRALSSRGQPLEGWPGAVRSFAVDLNHGKSLRPALSGVEGAFMLSGYDDAGLLEEMERAGVKRTVLLSSGSVGTVGSDNAVAAYHLASEQALQASAIAWTLLRPNTFMTNTLRWAEAIRAGRPVLAPFADVAIATNDPRDIAAVASAALASGDHSGRTYRITGPQALRPAEQVAVLGDVLGRELIFEAQSNEDARSEMEASMPDRYVDAFFEFFDEGKIDETTVLPTVLEVTGCEPRTLRQWASEHVTAFS